MLRTTALAVYLIHSLTFAVPGPRSSGAETKRLSDYWREVPVTWAMVERRVDQPHCYADFRRFQACLEAVNAGLQAAKAPAYLTLDGMSPRSGKVRAEFGALKVRELTEAEATGDERKWREELRLAAETQFKASPRIDFPALHKWLRTQLGDGESAIAASALNGYLAFATDPHTRLIPSRFMNDQRKGDARHFVGVGMHLKRDKAMVVVGGVLEGSPAAVAGVRLGDVILQIDGEALSPLLSLEDAVKKLEGPEGSRVQLTARRRQQLTLTFQMTRKPLVARPVSFRMVTRENRKWGYLRLGDLAHRGACDEAREAISRLVADGAKGFELDLRDNPGGLIAEAVCVANLFLPTGKKIVTVKELPPARGSQTWTTSEPQLTQLPVVTLVNASTASAAEIVAGAFQDYARGPLVGVRTFGKGSVQDSRPWREAKGVDFLYTMARFYLPTGRTIQITGVSPEIEAFNVPHPTDEETMFPREGDRYVNALPAEITNTVTPAKPSASLAICLKSGPAEKKAEAGGGDYQLLVADDAMACSIEI